MKNTSENTDREYISKNQYAKPVSENQYSKQQLDELKCLLFGCKSDCFVPYDDAQISLFELEKQKAEVKIEEIHYSCKKTE
jgi:hypothetical protein